MFRFFCVVSKNVQKKLWCPLEFMFTTLDTLWECPFSGVTSMAWVKPRANSNQAMPYQDPMESHAIDQLVD